MKKLVSRKGFMGLALPLALAGLAIAGVTDHLTRKANAADEGGAKRYQVTVVNLNIGQPLAPPILIPHSARFVLFNPGMSSATATSCGPGSYFQGGGLQYLAEQGDPGCLAGELATDPDVDGANIVTSDQQGTTSIVASATVDPNACVDPPNAGRGPIRTFIVTTSATHLTIAAMYGVTNDTFVAVTLRLPRQGGGESTYGNAWDAGSEGNTEAPGHLGPLGPPCGPGNPIGEHDANGEGTVSIGNGFHTDTAGIPNDRTFDWQNPGVLIEVRRMR